MPTTNQTITASAWTNVAAEENVLVYNQDQGNVLWAKTTGEPGAALVPAILPGRATGAAPNLTLAAADFASGEALYMRAEHGSALITVVK